MKEKGKSLPDDADIRKIKAVILTRTHGLCVANASLYQLSHIPEL